MKAFAASRRSKRVARIATRGKGSIARTHGGVGGKSRARLWLFSKSNHFVYYADEVLITSGLEVRAALASSSEPAATWCRVVIERGVIYFAVSATGRFLGRHVFGILWGKSSF